MIGTTRKTRRTMRPGGNGFASWSIRSIPLAVFVLIASSPATAASRRVLTLGVTGGTLGIGPELGYEIDGLLDVRASATFLGVNGTGRVDGYRYRGHVTLAEWGGMIDLHPFGNGFRLSAGVRATGGDHIRFSGSPATPQEYGGVLYPGDRAARIHGTIRTADVSPLVTIGYVRGVASRLVVGVDGGVMFHGHPHVDPVGAEGEILTNPAAGNELAREEAELRGRVRDYPCYPVLQLGIGYRF